ncbi:tripartite tricarboxylate transporter substrate binding protein [Acetobacteraceae bacterium H6797]|nr:tripartite tricarboxylate transporter substrate binding protein [Acetobacteraceae bacterium H6797]
MTLRRHLLLAAPALMLAGKAMAQGTPLRIIVPAPPGGPTDILARVLADKASVTLGRPVVVDNRGGGGGVIGTDAAARSAPDGNTIVLGHNQTHASNQSMMAKLPYNAIDSFTAVARLATVHHALVVPPDSPAKTVAELVSLGRTKQLTFASSQAGSASHVIGETFSRRAGLNATHVPYRGAAQAATDTVSGIVDYYVATFPSVSPLIRDGRLRALEIGAPARLPDFPNVPTAAEAGVPYLAVDAWFGLFAPAGTPAPAVAEISKAMLDGLKDPSVTPKLTAAGFTAAPQGPAEFAAFQREEVERWKEMVALTGVKIED